MSRKHLTHQPVFFCHGTQLFCLRVSRKHLTTKAGGFLSWDTFFFFFSCVKKAFDTPDGVGYTGEKSQHSSSCFSRLCKCVCVLCLHPIYSGQQQSTTFRVKWVHEPGSHTNNSILRVCVNYKHDVTFLKVCSRRTVRRHVILDFFFFSRLGSTSSQNTQLLCMISYV